MILVGNIEPKRIYFLIYRILMDKQLLDALGNLSDAIEMMAEVLGKKEPTNTTTTNALVSGDFSTQLIAINDGIKSIKEDTQEILKKQDTILKMSSKKEDNKTGLFKEAGGEKEESSLKKGVGTILLIAVGVLAIGLALKIVGNIDFISVVGLGLAIVLISVAFEKVAKLKISRSEAINTVAVMVAMSAGITLSSWILRLVTPISLGQAVTSILIAGVFTVISFGMAKLIGAFKGVDPKEVAMASIMLPLILPVIAFSIAVSSWALGMVRPISLGQAVTSILIAGVFTVISFGMSKLIGAFKGVDPKEVVMAALVLPIMLPLIAVAIAVSSWALGMVKPISLGQAITSILIAGVFTIISFGMEKLINAFKGVDPKEAAITAGLILLLLPAMALSIAFASHALGMVEPISFEQFLTSLGIAILFIALSFSMKLIFDSLKDVSPGKAIIMAGLVVLLLPAMSWAISESSKILAKSEPIPFDKSFKILVFGGTLALLAAGLGFVISKLGNMTPTQLITGGIAVVGIAGVIALSSQLLALGTYKDGEYPNLKWAIGVGLSLGAFGTATFLLGSVAVSGLGAVALLAGSAAVLLVAATIAATSHILGNGKYGVYPNAEWAVATGLSMGGFGLAIMGIGTFIVGSLGLGMVALIAGINGVKLIAQSIVDVSFILKKGSYSGGPTKVWSEGIGLAISAFAPVYKALSSGGFFSVKVTPEEMSKGILAISDGIITAADKFNTSKAVFKKGPSKEWAEGIGTAIAAFAPVYKALSSGGFWSLSKAVSPEDMVSGIEAITDGIITAANKFADAKATFDPKNAPNVAWGKGVSSAFSAFSPIFGFIKDNSGWFSSGVNKVLYVIDSVGNSIVKTAKTLYNGRRFFTNVIDPNYMKGLASNVIDYANLAKSLTTTNEEMGGLKSMMGLDPMSQTVRGMVKLAGAYDKLATSLTKFGGALQSIDGGKVDMIRRLTGNLAILSAMNTQAFNSILTTLEDRSSVFSKLVDGDITGGTQRVNVGDKKGTAVNTATKKTIKSKYGDTHQQLDTVIDLLSNINNSTSSLDEYISSVTNGKINVTSLSK
jgi:hypothetical protein